MLALTHLVNRHLLFQILLWSLILSGISYGQTPTSLPESSFEFFWKEFEERYPFFELHGVDWKASYDTYRPRVDAQTTDRELFAIMSQMLSNIPDAQVSLRNEQQTFYAGRPSTLTLMREDRSYQHLWHRNLSHSLHQEGFDPFDYAFTLEGKIIMAYTTSGRFGYLNIKCFEGVSSKRLDKIMDTIWEKIQDLEGLILDVRNNPGGDMKLAYRIAQRFAKQRVIGLYEQGGKPRSNKRSSNLKPYHLSPEYNTNVFSEQVVLLTNDATYEAAEAFALAMRELPQVTVMGEPSHGTFSNAWNGKLPNGWTFGLSHKRIFSAQMVSYEGKGVPVDIWETYPLQQKTLDRDPVFDKALTFLRNSQQPADYDIPLR